jgi:hypothetical protein
VSGFCALCRGVKVSGALVLVCMFFRYSKLECQLQPSRPSIKESTSQLKITIKRRANRALYLKIIIQFRKISNYGTNSKFQGISCVGFTAHIFIIYLTTFISL